MGSGHPPAHRTTPHRTRQRWQLGSNRTVGRPTHYRVRRQRQHHPSVGPRSRRETVILINIGSAFMIVQRVDLKTSSVPSSTLDRTILGDHRVNHPSLST